MAEIRFYHLTRSRLEEALVRLLQRVLERGDRAVVLAGSGERVEALNAHLWTFDAASFLPHGTARDGNSAEQPVFLTSSLENPNGARLLMLCDGADAPNAETLAAQGFDLVCELFNGQDEAALAAAREHWRRYRDSGQNIAYFQQNETGGWVEKARQ
ncbi:DNA polymerase III chi subunit [Dongia mobilis]|uniref:DNA polymerase III chi subunit n=1 Tax=Dongia mobilis TaxID=578943 RepID=A0A4R6WFY9_9PROT|nr:DNA polymerase III subunit chi [Dongia mobilis]TDQ78940.1 DNA polymerase III chi subunit [Dongia mobilis]